MIEFKCVKCGTTVQTDDPNYNWYPLRAPSCKNCCREVIDETSDEHSMWPNDWHGGWLWQVQAREWVYWKEEKEG